MASRKDEKEESERKSASENVSKGMGGMGTTSSPQQELQHQQDAVNRSLEETKQNIKEAIEEARREIPKYNQVVNDYQNQTIDATKDIAESYLDSQRRALNSMQSNWNQNILMQQQQQSWWGLPTSPQSMADMYSKMAGSFADATIATTRLANIMMFANIEAARTIMNQARDSAKEMARITINLSDAFTSQSPRDSQSRPRTSEEERRRRS